MLMNVVYASNDCYARHLAVSMYSLFDHNQVMERIRVFVLEVGLSAESRGRLQEIAEHFDRELVFIPMGDLKDRFPYEVDTGGFDISAMGRLFVGTVLPETVERVLYLDCDTVVLASLRKLWEMNLGGRMLGAVMEPTIYPQVKEAIGLGKEEPYFNSGVLLIDVKRWREAEAERRLIEFYGSLGGKTFACDQDTLNGALRGQIKSISPRYNFFTNYRYFHYRDLAEQSSAYRAVSKDVFLRAKRHPAILHYAGDERPWKAGNLGHYRKAYEQYLSMTPWRGTPKEDGGAGQRIYLLAYHMMDYLTWICPPARRAISRRLGMQAVERRADKQADQQEDKRMEKESEGMEAAAAAEKAECAKMAAADAETETSAETSTETSTEKAGSAGQDTASAKIERSGSTGQAVVKNEKAPEKTEDTEAAAVKAAEKPGRVKDAESTAEKTDPKPEGADHIEAPGAENEKE